MFLFEFSFRRFVTSAFLLTVISASTLNAGASFPHNEGELSDIADIAKKHLVPVFTGQHLENSGLESKINEIIELFKVPYDQQDAYRQKIYKALSSQILNRDDLIDAFCIKDPSRKGVIELGPIADHLIELRRRVCHREAITLLLRGVALTGLSIPLLYYSIKEMYMKYHSPENKDKSWNEIFSLTSYIKPMFSALVLAGGIFCFSKHNSARHKASNAWDILAAHDSHWA